DACRERSQRPPMNERTVRFEREDVAGPRSDGYDVRGRRGWNVGLAEAVVTPDQNSAVPPQDNAVIIAGGDGDDIGRIRWQDTLAVARRSEQVVRPRTPS